MKLAIADQVMAAQVAQAEETISVAKQKLEDCGGMARIVRDSEAHSRPALGVV